MAALMSGAAVISHAARELVAHGDAAAAKQDWNRRG